MITRKANKTELLTDEKPAGRRRAIAHDPPDPTHFDGVPVASDRTFYLAAVNAEFTGMAGSAREEGPEFVGHAFWVAAVVGCQVAAPGEFGSLCPGQDAGEGVEGGLEVGGAVAAAQQRRTGRREACCLSAV